MSLTSFVKIPEVNERIQSTFEIPEFNRDKPLLAIPRTKNYAQNGTAFDYILRFQLKQKNPEATDQPWVAEHAMDILNDIAKNARNEKDSATFNMLGQNIEKIILKAKKDYHEFLKTGALSKSLIESAIFLAKIDVFYRNPEAAFNALQSFNKIDPEDVRDLKELADIVPDTILNGHEKVWLNPTFPVGSELVGGADADLILDNTLIDIKTTKYLKLDKNYWSQLVGYAVLSRIAKKKDKTFPRIESVGIYFSRHAHAWSVPIDFVYKNPEYSNFEEWFVKMAEKEFRGTADISNSRL